MITPGVTPRPEITGLSMDQHGGPDHGELTHLGLTPADVLDFSASTNPFGPPPQVRVALSAGDIARYPDRLGEPLRGALAAGEGVPSGRVLLANGAAQLIWSVALAYLRIGDTSLIAGPTFGEYRVASELMGAHVVEVRAGAETRFVPDPAAIRSDLDRWRPRLAWLCNPNNPTGSYLDAATVSALVRDHPATLWILDEAYRPFLAASWDSLPLVDHGNVLLLRSLTKDCALPGLRIGYALGAEPIIDALRRATPPWSLSAAAIAGGLAALSVRPEVAGSIRAVRDEAARLAAGLAGQGWAVLPSATHFFLVAAPAGGGTLRARLLQEFHIQVRDCASFGLPGFVRIAARTPAENDCLLQAMEAMR